MSAIRLLVVAVAVIAGVAIIAIAIGAVWLNSYIHSPAFKAEIESRVSDAVGGTAQLQSVDFDILHGVKLEGLVLQVDASHSGGQGAIKVKVALANCTCSWSELLNRRLRLTGITLEKPVFDLTKQPTAPMSTPSGATSPATSPASSSTAPTETTTQGDALPFQFVLDRLTVRDGTVTVRDASGQPIVDLHGVQTSADTAGYFAGRELTGSLSVATAALPSHLQLSDFSTKFSYRQNFLEASPLDATAFGGRIAGDYQSGNSAPSVLDLNAKDLDVAKISAVMPDTAVRWSGALDVQSKWRGIETGDLAGEGDAAMTNGKVEGVRLLEDLARILRTKELAAPRITKFQTHFVVANREARLIGLALDSPTFRMTGDGTIAFDGPVNANLVLILTRDTMERIPKDVAASFVQQADGTGSIAFQVTGTMDDLQTDLPTRLLLQNTKVQNVINKALNKFFH